LRENLIDGMEQVDIFDILPTSVRSCISAFISLRQLNSLSIMPSQHQLTGKGTEKLVVTSHHAENQVIRFDDIAAETRMEVADQPKEQVQMASAIRWRYAEQGRSVRT
jgi:hypothetical protein